LKIAAIAALLVLALAQALVIGRVELTFDEAYYALWARWPQTGYLDHPPLVAWTIAASQALFGGAEFGVRGLFWLMGLSLPALIAWIGWRLFEDATTAAAAALIFMGAPLVAGTLLATPDTPLVFFWTLALAGLVEVWRGRAWGWALVGLATGAAGLAKMTAGFLALGVALALVATPSLRRQWRRPGPWLAAALALAVLSPFLVWNATHGFATFFKQGGRLEARALAPHYLGEFVGSQFLLFNPLTAAAALYGARRQGAPGEPVRLLLGSIAPALAYFALHALHDRVQGNWLAPLYPALALLAARATREMRWLAPAAAALGLAAVVIVYWHVLPGRPAFGRADPTLRIGGWRELAADVSVLADERHAGFVLAEGYAATSLLSFYGGRTQPVVQAGEPERWTFRPPVAHAGEGLAFGSPSFAATLGRLYARVRPLQTLHRRAGGLELEPYVLFSVEGPR
jgi:4-amino-4-deoxy-L-arabinose transferase-like glycosyltransferase